MRITRSRLLPALAAVVGLFLAGSPAQAADAGSAPPGYEPAASAVAEPSTAIAPAPGAPSIPIDLPAGPAEPAPNELVGGFHGFLVAVGLILLIVLLVVLIVRIVDD